MHPSHTLRHLMCLGTREATETFRWFFGTKNAPSHFPAAPNFGYYLTPTRFSVNCAFFMATQPHTVSPMLPIETPHELDFPQREAAFFYGLFLRGHSPEQLRRDISRSEERRVGKECKTRQTQESGKREIGAG